MGHQLQYQVIGVIDNLVGYQKRIKPHSSLTVKNCHIIKDWLQQSLHYCRTRLPYFLFMVVNKMKARYHDKNVTKKKPNPMETLTYRRSSMYVDHIMVRN